MRPDLLLHDSKTRHGNDQLQLRQSTHPLTQTALGGAEQFIGT